MKYVEILNCTLLFMLRTIAIHLKVLVFLFAFSIASLTFLFSTVSVLSRILHMFHTCELCCLHV